MRSIGILGHDLFFTRKPELGWSPFLDLKRFGVVLPQTIFDIGAHEGGTAETLRKAFPDAAVYCFEPSPEPFKRLAKLCAKIRANANNLAVGDFVGATDMYVDDSQLSSLVPGLNELRSGATLVASSMTTIDHFCRQKGIATIDILKTDTEGFELEVLAGANEMLSGNNIQAVYVECSLNKNPRHVSVGELLLYLKHYRFKICGLYEQRGFGDDYFCNALFLNSDYTRSGDPVASDLYSAGNVT